jgi:predicted CXXCH cytochrome family protein
MLQPSSSASVLGDFSQPRITLRGTSYRLHVKPDGYFINEQLLSGGEREHRVDYTLGSRRIQHYLTRLADGRIIVLPPSWDVLRKQWFHNFDIVDPQETEGGAVQVWNKSCYSCHVTREEKNFDAASNTYNTTWQDFGTSCERCHGQGAGHMLLHRETPANSSGDDITRLGGLDPARSTAVCAQCHSLRDMLTKTFAPGQNYLDSFMPILEYGQKKDHDPAYWVDGRPRRFSNDAIGFWQSACFMRGDATCLSCHANVHDPAIPANRIIREEPNALCSGCHGTLSINVANHSHHAAGSRGSE